MDMDGILATIGQADNALKGLWAPLDNFHNQTKIPRAAAASGAALLFIMVFFNIGAAFLVNTVGVIVPSFYQLRGIHDKAVNTEQWISYWMIFTSSIILERLFNFAYWFPLYFLLKLAFLAYLGLPSTNGATVIFNSVIQPTASRIFSCTSGAVQKASDDQKNN